MAVYNLNDPIPSGTILYRRDVLNCPYSGKRKSITLPSGRYTLECWGAQGGIPSVLDNGRGGYSIGVITLMEDTTLYLYVGGQGLTDQQLVGGFNGGGGFQGTKRYIEQYAGGGGASDIRVGQDSLYARVIVAGGGGGNGIDTGSAGEGGGENGLPAYGFITERGQGGTQIKAGEYTGTIEIDDQPAGFGYGGAGPDGPTGGCGGGGWYGGSFGKRKDGGGGGGSGFVYTEHTYQYWVENSEEGRSGQWLLTPEYYLRNAQTIAGNQRFLSPGGVIEQGHNGNGFIRITVGALASDGDSTKRFQYLPCIYSDGEWRYRDYQNATLPPLPDYSKRGVYSGEYEII